MRRVTRHRIITGLFALGAGSAAVFAVISCKREARQFETTPANAQASTQNVVVTDLYAGGNPATNPASTARGIEKNPYEQNAYALSQGKTLFSMYNCVGCHAHGGGGMGPPLKDEKWIYGSEPDQIYATIVQGRPNGMPSFRGKIPNNQVWQLVAYVRSLSGLVNKNAAPGRDDHMQVGPPEASTPATRPVNTGVPKSAEMPQ
jgi:cytochrome c oxidase cbb3-type subunit 3